MGRFTALPVDGDGFVLEREEQVVLVDGGRSADELVDELVDALPHITSFDIIVCTHADEDHAGGLAELFAKWQARTGSDLKVKAFWLPAIWASVIARALDGGLELDVLDEEARKLLQDGVLDKPRQSGEDSERVADDDDPLAIADENAADLYDASETLEQIAEYSPPRLLRLAERFRERADDMLLWPLRPRATRLALTAREAWWLSQLLTTGERLTTIAANALSNGATIRWFDYQAFKNGAAAAGGDQNFLEPVNCVRVGSIRRQKSLLVALALSKVNTESLVFVAPERGEEPAVLFTADSPFMWASGRGKRPAVTGCSPKRTALLTAPHHGAKTNDRAYAPIQTWAPAHHWVRSGGQSRHPDGQFKLRPNRSCTWCPHQGYSYEAVSATSGTAGWSVTSPRRACVCP